MTDAQRKENTLRMAQEDSIRNAYVASFPTEEKAKAFAEGLKLDVNQTSTYILKSRGNHADIMQFLSNAAEKNRVPVHWNYSVHWLIKTCATHLAVFWKTICMLPMRKLT